MEKGKEGELSLGERVQMNMHMKICDKCTEYDKQSTFIDNAIKNNKTSILPQEQLSDNSKAKIQQLIDQSLKNS